MSLFSVTANTKYLHMPNVSKCIYSHYVRLLWDYYQSVAEVCCKCHWWKWVQKDCHENVNANIKNFPSSSLSHLLCWIVISSSSWSKIFLLNYLTTYCGLIYWCYFIPPSARDCEQQKYHISNVMRCHSLAVWSGFSINFCHKVNMFWENLFEVTMGVLIDIAAISTVSYSKIFFFFFFWWKIDTSSTYFWTSKLICVPYSAKKDTLAACWRCSYT